MVTYAIWVNLLPGVDDMEFSRCVQRYLDFFVQQGQAVSWSLQRRMFGFGPDALGEWHVAIRFTSVSQMDLAFQSAAARSGELEELHAAVYSKVTGFRSGLYRDFPDAVRDA
jgi:hypothetical protein